MSMHLVGPYLSTNSTKKKEQKITKSKQAELEHDWKERNESLKKMGLSKQSFDQYMEWRYGRGKKSKTETKYGAKGAPLSPQKTITVRETKKSIEGPADMGECAVRPSTKYTGTAMIGIATMHKSNMVPVFSNQEAEDISKMRRG
jgi:hypothetical protein